MACYDRPSPERVRKGGPMIKHGYCPTCGTYTAESSYVGGLDIRREREDSLTDEEIAVEVRERLAAADATHLKQVQVTVLNAVVTLVGEVPNKQHKKRAAELTFDLPAVMDVHNLLTLTEPAPQTR